jgi:hypothetical protein
MWGSGEVFELRSSVLPISESASSSWPTPLKDQVRGSTRKPKTGGKILSEEAANWLTPTVGDCKVDLHGAATFGTLSSDQRLRNQAVNWPTARAEDGESCGNHPGAVDSLTGAVKMWPTPTEDNANNAGGPSRTRGMLNGGYVDLTVAARLWATPQAHDGHGPKTPEQIQVMRERCGAGVRNLNEDVAMWQTPATDSFRSRGGDRKDEMGLDQQARVFPSSHRDHRTPDGPQSSPNVPTLRRRLNPRFVEWLMGFPIGWTEL